MFDVHQKIALAGLGVVGALLAVFYSGQDLTQVAKQTRGESLVRSTEGPKWQLSGFPDDGKRVCLGIGESAATRTAVWNLQCGWGDVTRGTGNLAGIKYAVLPSGGVVAFGAVADTVASVQVSTPTSSITIPTRKFPPTLANHGKVYAGRLPDVLRAPRDNEEWSIVYLDEAGNALPPQQFLLTLP